MYFAHSNRKASITPWLPFALWLLSQNQKSSSRKLCCSTDTPEAFRNTLNHRLQLDQSTQIQEPTSIDVCTIYKAAEEVIVEVALEEEEEEENEWEWEESKNENIVFSIRRFHIGNKQ